MSDPEPARVPGPLVIVVSLVLIAALGFLIWWMVTSGRR